MLRRKVRWVEHGEKCKIFFNLEKKTCWEKKTPETQAENGLEVDDPDSILKEQGIFFKSLYSSNNDNVENQVYDVLLKMTLSLRYARKILMYVKATSRKKNAAKNAAKPQVFGFRRVHPRVLPFFFGRTSLMTS